jgi:molybdopterin-guanine dinucleotide biosynthesis protein A
MGRDKAKLLVEGEPLAARIARLIRERDIPVTALGREPIEGCAFHPDEEEFAGPLAALSGFKPNRARVFVASCDLTGFNPAVIDLLDARLTSYDAAIPLSNRKLQPLCALYRASAFDQLSQLAATGEKRIMRWIDSLRIVEVEDVEESWVRNVNTPDDLLS